MRVDQLERPRFSPELGPRSVSGGHTNRPLSGTRGASDFRLCPRDLVRDTDSTPVQTAMLASLASLSRGPRLRGRDYSRATRIHRRQTLAAWPGSLSVAQRVQPEHLVLVVISEA